MEDNSSTKRGFVCCNFRSSDASSTSCVKLGLIVSSQFFSVLDALNDLKVSFKVEWICYDLLMVAELKCSTPTDSPCEEFCN